jgi:hypothetical protein
LLSEATTASTKSSSETKPFHYLFKSITVLTEPLTTTRPTLLSKPEVHSLLLARSTATATEELLEYVININTSIETCSTRACTSTLGLPADTFFS